MNLILVFSLSFQCMLNTLTVASKTQITPGWKFHFYKPAPKKDLNRFLRAVLTSSGGKLDTRLLALSMNESGARINIRRGDKGKACGVYQIHARFSYPLFRRKNGFNGWVENKNKRLIERECRKLQSATYSVSTMKRLLSKMDAKKLHPCHHNSGFYGKCNTWYKKRLDYWLAYFYIAKQICTNENTKGYFL